MSLQSILSICESIGINDHRFIGQTLSRNQRISTSEILTVVPFEFELKPMNYLLYSQSRSILNGLRKADKANEQVLNFGSTGWLNYIAYRGEMTDVQIAACQWQTASANKTLVLGNLPAIASTKFIVREGDFVQLDRYSYIVTADVLRGSGSTVNIPVHRTCLTTLTSPLNAVIGQYGTTVAINGLTYVGISFPLIMREYPTYTLIPMTNDSFIQWSGQFRAIEAVL